MNSRKIIVIDGITYSLVPDKPTPRFRHLDTVSMDGEKLGTITSISDDNYIVDFGDKTLSILDQDMFTLSGRMKLVPDD